MLGFKHMIQFLNPSSILEGKEVPAKVEDTEEVTGVSEYNEVSEVSEQDLEQIDDIYEENIGLNDELQSYVSPEGIEEVRKNYENVESILGNIEGEIKDVESPLELQRLDKNIQTYKGTVFEDINKEALKDKFESIDEKQILVETSEGVTKPDIILHEAKEDMKIGNLTLEKGENLSIETKCGSPEYIKSEMDHMLKQVLGHQGDSLVVVTKDYEKIDPVSRKKFEDDLKDRGSHIYVSDVYANQVSNAIRDNVNI